VHIFIYEYLTANGIGQTPWSPDHGMYLEGRAMRDAIVEDFSRVADTEAFAFPDAAAPVALELFEKKSGESDWTVLIAPALDNCLSQLAESVQRAGGRLLGPSTEAIRLASDKLCLFHHWRSHNILTPATSEREPTACEAFPVVWKPRNGTGSTMTFLLNSPNDVLRAQAVIQQERFTAPMILQNYAPGQAASIAFLCGPAGNIPLLPASQQLSENGRFAYLGGVLPLLPELAKRARQLGQEVVDCLPGLVGYVGVDLVLGPAEDGTQDHAIEINPRLTTSYVGLRQLAEFNIAAAMLSAAHGEACGPLEWKSGHVHFDSRGSCTWTNPKGESQ
jgi:tyramine---L-glutamate ligase